MRSKLHFMVVILMIISFLVFFEFDRKEDEVDANEPIYINYARGHDPTGVTRDIIRAFGEQNPSIYVNYLEMPESVDQQHNAYVTALDGGDNSVDIYWVEDIWMPEFAAAGWLAPLNDYLEKHRKTEFVSRFVDNFTINDKIYAVPAEADIGMLFYRKDLVPTLPKTLQQLDEISKRLVREGRVKYGYAAQTTAEEDIVCGVEEYLHNFGLSIYDYKADDAAKLKTYRELITSPLVKEGFLQSFIHGDVAFMRNWSYAWSIANSDDSKVRGKTGVAMLPGKTPVIKTCGLAVNRFSKNKEAALQFIDFYTQADIQKLLAVKTGMLPVLEQLYKDEGILEANPYMKYDNILTNVIERPKTEKYTQMSTEIQNYLCEFFNNNISANEASSQIAAALMKIQAAN